MARGAIKLMPPCEALHLRFSYDPYRGELRARQSVSGNGGIGSLAGCDNSHGYLVVGIGGILYQSSRVIWKMMTGQEPREIIDHKDGNPLNNKWDNLRCATYSQNLQNTKLYRNNKSGVKGVSWHGVARKWVAYISVNKTRTNLGLFDRIEDAAIAVEAERSRLHAEFARAA